MTTNNNLEKKIDFAVILRVKNANPNGDPLNGNRPRIGCDGIGEISDVCLKRKLRDRLQEQGEKIFVQSAEKSDDGHKTLKARYDAFEKGQDNSEALCKQWFDVRAFGQVFSFKGKKEKEKGVSIGIRGPVTIQSAFSVEPVTVSSMQITKSVSNEGDGTKTSDTMGMKHRVDNGFYVFFGSINPQLAERTGFTNGDAETIKKILPKLFENDASSARPEGSISVEKVIWWDHGNKSGQYSSVRVHRTLTVKADGSYELKKLDNLPIEEIDGY